MLNLINEYPVSALFYMLLASPFVLLFGAWSTIAVYKDLKLRFKRGLKGYQQVSRANKIYKIQREEEMKPHSESFWNARHEYLLKNVK